MLLVIRPGSIRIEIERAEIDRRARVESELLKNKQIKTILKHI